MTLETEFREYRAPRGHGETYVHPSLPNAPGVLDENIQLLASHAGSWAAMRQSARRELIDDAIRYTSAYRDVGWVDAEAAAAGPIIMAGHQPAIFHPGVWFKNFALNHLAKSTGAVAVNLVIDNDVASGSSIRVPRYEPLTEHSAYTVVPYDEAGGGVPYEQTTIRNRETFDHFDRHVKSAIAPLIKNPCVEPLWEHARAAVQRCGIAGCALAQARHALEGNLGLQTLELPLGVICRTSVFAEFTLSILTELPRFHHCYNDAANHYRRAHHIRSSAHPVPNLAEDGQWFEAPLWIYGDDAPQRRAAWVRLVDDQLVISDRVHREVRIDTRYPKLAAQQLLAVASPNFKLRPRALLTTMYSRLVLSDLFLHGIGGGKYDQLSDMIVRSFFMVPPPEFMVVSATVLLPGVNTTSNADQIRQLKRAIRDTYYQPERFAGDVRLDEAVLARKQQLLSEIPERGQRTTWHGKLQAVNEALAGRLDDKRAELRAELARAERIAASRSLLSSREHPFCIFPLDYLTEIYNSLLL